MAKYNLELLKIFYEVTKEGNVTRASENLFISQPAVSQSIKKLEDELGGTLFNRSNKGITLTSEGMELFSYVKSAFEILDKGEDEFENYRGLKKGCVKIGISTTLAKLILVEPLKNFHEDFPGVKIELVNGLTSDILEELERGKLDIVIFGGECENKKLEVREIGYLQHVFVYNKNFFNLENVKTNEELIKFPLILQNKNSNSRKLFDDMIKKKGVNEQDLTCTEVVSQELAKILASSGFGIGFVLKETIEKDDDLSILTLQEKIPEFRVSVARSSIFAPTIATKTFLKYLEN